MIRGLTPKAPNFDLRCLWKRTGTPDRRSSFTVDSGDGRDEDNFCGEVDVGTADDLRKEVLNPDLEDIVE